MNYLLLSADEEALRRYLVEELGLVPLGASEELDLPSQASHRTGPWEYVYWAQELGPLCRLGEAPPATSAVERVMHRMNEDSFGDSWSDAIDLARTPVIRHVRSSWNRNGHLNPGLLQGSAARVADQPRELLALRRRVGRWLAKDGERLNPFDHCIGSPISEPRNLNPFWVWARPHALSWVKAGGHVWPWNG